MSSLRYPSLLLIGMIVLTAQIVFYIMIPSRVPVDQPEIIKASCMFIKKFHPEINVIDCAQEIYDNTKRTDDTSS